ILVENNFGENLSYIRQDQNYYLLNGSTRNYRPYILTGPFSDRWSNLVVKNRFEQPFEPEGSSKYTISKGLIKQKSLVNLFSSPLTASSPVHDFHDFVLTENEIDSMWQEYIDNRSRNSTLFLNNFINKPGNGKLQVSFSK